MAKYTPLIWSEASGSVNGLTFQAGQGGNHIVRGKPFPVNPSSSFQTNIRSVFGQAVDRWENTLTDVLRGGWDYWAASQTIYRTGREAYIAAYSMANYALLRDPTAGFVWTDNAPVINLIPGATVVEAAPAGPGTGVAVSITPTDAQNVFAMVQISTLKSHATNYWKGPWDVTTLQVVDLGVVSTLVEFLDLEDTYIYFVHVRTFVADSPAIAVRPGSSYIIRATAQVVV